MPGLFFDSGISKGFEKDLQRMNREMNSLSKNVQKQGTSIDNTFSKISRNIAGLVTIGALSAAGKELVTFTNDLETALTEVATISEIVTENFDEYKDTLLALSTDEERGAEGAIKLTEALYGIVSAGFDGAEGLELLSVTGRAATAGFVEASIAADGMTTVMNAWGLNIDEAEKVSDIFFKTVEKGKTTFPELGKNIAQVAPIAASMGVSFEEVQGAIATITKQGTPTAQAFTQVRASLVAMNEVLGDGWAEAMTYQEALQEIREQAGGSQNELVKMLGRVEAVNAVLSLTGDNATGAAEDLEAMRNALGATAVAAQKVTQTTSHQITLLKNNILAALAPLGEGATGVIASLAKDLNEAFQSGNAQKFAKVLAALAAAFVTYKVSVLAVNQVEKIRRLLLARNIEATQIAIVTGKKMTAANLTMAKSFKSLRIAFAANPIGLLVTGLTLAIPLISEFLDTTDSIVNQMSSLDKITEEYNKTLADSTTEAQSYFVQLKETNKGSKDRAGLIKIINERYGTTLKNLEDESEFLAQIDKAYISVVASLKKKLALEAQQKKLVELINQEVVATELLSLAKKELIELEKQQFTSTFDVTRFEFLKKQVAAYELLLTNAQQKQKDLIKNTAKTINTLEESIVDPNRDVTDPKALKQLQSFLEDQKKLYSQYNVDIEGLTGERLQAVEDEYKFLTDQGKVYLTFLEDLLAKEKSAKKQAIIKKEIATVTFEANVEEQQASQKTFDRNKEDLKKLLEQFATYTSKRKEIETQYAEDIQILRDATKEEQALEAEKALQVELNQLDAAIVSGSAKFKQWVSVNLPQLAKEGVGALQRELDKVQLALTTEGLDPEQVVIFQAKIEALTKKLKEKQKIEIKSEQTWKDSLELINGVNELVDDLINSFDDFDDKTKNVFTGITEISAGLINMAQGFKAVAEAASALDKASAILAAISLTLKVIQKINKAFDKAREIRAAAHLAEIEQIHAVNVALIEQIALYEEGSSFFTEDRWGTALAGLEAYNRALEFQNDLLVEIQTSEEDITDQPINLFGLSLGGVISRTNEVDQLREINEDASKLSTQLARTLSSISIKTLDRSGFANFFGFSDEFSSLLTLYPKLIDANGELDTVLLQTIIDTEELSEADKLRLQNLIDLVGQAEAAYAQFGEFISSIFGGVGDEIAQAFQVMFESGDDAMSALEESFSDMIESFTRDAIQFAFLQPYLNELNEKTQQLGEQFARGEITADELQQGIIKVLGGFYDTLGDLQPALLEAFQNADRLAAEAGFESAFEGEEEPIIIPEEPEEPIVSRAGEISQAITEETGSQFVGRLGAIMLSNQVLVNNSNDMLDYAIRSLTYLGRIADNSDFLPTIAENTKRTYEKLEGV